MRGRPRTLLPLQPKRCRRAFRKLASLARAIRCEARLGLHLLKLESVRCLCAILLPLQLSLLSLGSVYLHSLEEVQLLYWLGQFDPLVVLLLDERILILEHDVVQMLGVPIDQHVVVHQIDDVIGGHAALAIHLGQLLLYFVLLLPGKLLIPILLCDDQKHFLQILIEVL